MFSNRFPPVNKVKHGLLFCLGWAVVMLAMTVAIPPALNTFIHAWRVEFLASVFLAATLLYIIYLNREKYWQLNISHYEFSFIVLPILVFIIWSAVSIIWAPSWRSVAHHTLIWCSYLIFYVTVRQLLNRKIYFEQSMTMVVSTLAFFGFLAAFGYCSYLIFGGGTSLGFVYAKYGEQVNAISPLLIVGVLRMNQKRFVFGLLGLAVIWLLIFCSLSRINIFLFVCGTIAVAACVFIFKRFHKYRRKMLIVAAVIILAPVPLHIFALFADDANIPMVSRISDESGISSSNNFRKLMATLSFEMFKEHPVTGIGADNFGMQVNNYRSIYGEANPYDVNLAAAENDLPERSHNEYLQILAELGIVGGLIFLWFLAGIFLMVYRLLTTRTSLIPIAAIIGIGAFLISSLVSSYSFRFIQNGFVFFFVLAVAAKFLLRSEDKRSDKITLTAFQLKMACAAGIIACLMLTAYSVIRVSSVYQMEKANYTQDLDEATDLYRSAMLIDDENPNAHFHLGHRLFHAERYSEAAEHLKRSIEMGQAGSPTFSYLSTAQMLSGDMAAAESTFAAAVKIYPQSTFVLTRYAFLLKQNGKDAESTVQMERALAINKNTAITWWTLMNEGTQKATDDVTRNKELRSLMDLQPSEAAYAIITERGLRFPAEKQKFPSDF